MRAWVVVLAGCLLFASCQQNPERLVVVRECGRVWRMPASDAGGFRRAVRLDCGFLTPRHERTHDATIGL
jgi:hypothetical protein